MRNILVILVVLSIQALFAGDLSAQDSTVVVKPVGFDAGNLVGAKRYRPQPYTKFHNDKFSDNLFFAFEGVAGAPRSADYGFSTSAHLSMKKWWTPSLGARFRAGGGYVYSNLNNTKLDEYFASAAVMFNFSSYVLGYDSSRFCEISAVIGPGYSYCGNMNPEQFFLLDLGLNVNLRLTKRLAVNLEPGIPMRINGKGLAYGFSTGVGMEYEFSKNVSKPSGAGRFFVSVMRGCQFQNSVLVRDAGVFNTLGAQYAVGIGREYSDYFALRFSAAHSFDTWAEYYGGFKMPAKYFALRLEGILDILRLCMNKSSDLKWGCGVIAGPEVGYLSKVDIESRLDKHYVGFVGGFYGDYRILKWLGVFVEPCFSIIPYTAPNNDSTSNNISKNYYDSLLKFNVGFEFHL